MLKWKVFADAVCPIFEVFRFKTFEMLYIDPKEIEFTFKLKRKLKHFEYHCIETRAVFQELFVGSKKKTLLCGGSFELSERSTLLYFID